MKTRADWRDYIPADRCQGCQWMAEGLRAFDDADGRRYWLCDPCRPAAEAEKAATLEARRKAAEAQKREAVGQLRIDGTGDAAPMRARQERLL